MSRFTLAIPTFIRTSPNTTPPSTCSYCEGNVRIYRGLTLYIGDEATYNVDTKAITAKDMRTGTYPYLMSGDRP